jgi:hypothetical protein
MMAYGGKIDAARQHAAWVSPPFQSLKPWREPQAFCMCAGRACPAPPNQRISALNMEKPLSCLQVVDFNSAESTAGGDRT